MPSTMASTAIFIVSQQRAKDDGVEEEIGDGAEVEANGEHRVH